MATENQVPCFNCERVIDVIRDGVTLSYCMGCVEEEAFKQCIGHPVCCGECGEKVQEIDPAPHIIREPYLEVVVEGKTVARLSSQEGWKFRADMLHISRRSDALVKDLYNRLKKGDDQEYDWAVTSYLHSLETL